MRVALVHYWLLHMRGGEKVLEALCRLFPDADIYTLFYDPERVSPLIRSHRVTASFLNPFRSSYRSLLPLMPLALEHFDLRDYDLVISSESGPAKGVITHSTTRHLCYSHTPMRYLWDLYPDYLHEWTTSGLQRSLMAVFGHYLRLWDYASAARVDHFVANSANTRRRLRHTYRRESDVVHPPVEVGACFSAPSRDDYYLAVSELVSYKRLAHAVAACARTGRRLRIVGEGPEYKTLRQLAGSAPVEFCGRVSDKELRELFAHCRAFLQPGEEDFGIASVEALASGKPVVGLGRGGILEIATAGQSGFFYPRPSVDGLVQAMEEFEGAESSLDHLAIAESTRQRFSSEAFGIQMQAIIGQITT